MKAILWRKQAILDDVDAKTLGNDACVSELRLSKRSACEVLLLLLNLSKGSGG